MAEEIKRAMAEEAHAQHDEEYAEGCPLCERDERAALAEQRLARLDETRADVRDALNGDSNDAEHDALALVAEALGLKNRYDERSGDWGWIIPEDDSEAQG